MVGSFQRVEKSCGAFSTHFTIPQFSGCAQGPRLATRAFSLSAAAVSTVIAAVVAAPAAAAAQQQDDHDDPAAAISAKEAVIITHIGTSYER
jgi:uncharacterized membrane protein